MRSAIVLIWLSLFWTLICFLFYRDRELIIQTSLPVWIAAGVAWIVYRLMGMAVRPWRRGAKPRGRKKAAPRAGGARRTSAAKPRKR